VCKSFGETVVLDGYLVEADQLSDHIALLDRGRIVAEGTPGELKRRIPGGHVQLHFSDPGALNEAARLLDVASRDDENLCLQVPSDSSAASLRPLLNRLQDARLDVEQVSTHTPDLDDVFFAVTGHPSAGEVPLS
jgi:ABC-2 type transport system ATP-binding protein